MNEDLRYNTLDEWKPTIADSNSLTLDFINCKNEPFNVCLKPGDTLEVSLCKRPYKRATYRYETTKMVRIPNRLLSGKEILKVIYKTIKVILK